MFKLILLSCVLVCCVLASKYHVKVTDADEAKYPVALVWDSATSSNYFADFGKNSNHRCLYRYDTSNGKTYSASIRGKPLGPPSFIIPVDSSSSKLKKFAVGFEDIVGLVAWNGKSDSAELIEEIVYTGDVNGPNERVGFGHRDPSGRVLYHGSMDLDYCGPAGNQSVYQKLRGYEKERLLSKKKLPSGWAFANGNVYILDSCSLKIYEFQTEKCSGVEKCDYRVAFSFKDIGKKSGDFFPFGLDADSYGNLYTVSYYSGSVYSIDPVAGKAHKIAQSPTGGTTSVSLGGSSGKDLYITVAKKIIDVQNGKTIKNQKPGTSLYVIKDCAKSPAFKRLKV